MKKYSISYNPDEWRLYWLFGEMFYCVIMIIISIRPFLLDTRWSWRRKNLVSFLHEIRGGSLFFKIISNWFAATWNLFACLNGQSTQASLIFFCENRTIGLRTSIGRKKNGWVSLRVHQEQRISFGKNLGDLKKVYLSLLHIKLSSLKALPLCGESFKNLRRKFPALSDIKV